MKEIVCPDNVTRVVHTISPDDGPPICFYTTTVENTKEIDGYKILVDSSNGRLRQITKVSSDTSDGVSILYNSSGDDSLNSHRIRKLTQFSEGREVAEYFINESERRRRGDVSSNDVVCIMHPNNTGQDSNNSENRISYSKSNPKLQKGIDKLLKRVATLEQETLEEAQKFFGESIELKAK